jgi:hypothetical protein
VLLARAARESVRGKLAALSVARRGSRRGEGGAPVSSRPRTKGHEGRHATRESARSPSGRPPAGRDARREHTQKHCC